MFFEFWWCGGVVGYCSGIQGRTGIQNDLGGGSVRCVIF